MAKERRIRVKEPFWIKVLRVFIRPLARLMWGYKVKNKYKAKKGENIIVLSNHQTDYDPILIRLSFNRFLYTVATDNIFSNPKTVKWLTRLGAVPKRKGLADLKSTIAMSNIAEKGGSLLLFPEGNRSYAEFQFYISENFAKLLKSLKCTIVLFNLHGGFGCFPRFGAKKRKGPFYGRIKKVLKYKDYEHLTPEELNEVVKEYLEQFDVDDMHLYKSKRKAEFLERMYFVCPVCGNIHSLRSEGNILKCQKCGLEVEYTESLTLKSDNPEFKFTKLNDWYEYQKQWVRDYQVKKGEVIFEDENTTLTLSNPYQDRQLLSEGKLVLTDEKLTVGDYSFDIKDIAIASPVSGRNLCVTINENNYVIRGEERFNALKYVLMFNKLETKMKIEEVDKYFNI